MPDDYRMTDGDNVMDATNNYERTTTAAGKMYRCATAHRGHWPGGDEEFGCALYERLPLKNSPKARQQCIDDFTEAMQPLVDAGLIRDVSVIYVEATNISHAEFRITAYDTSTQSDVSVPVPAPWGS
jgi:hypothetical protein